MCWGSLAFSVMVLGVKWSTATLPALEVVFFRSLLGSLMMTGLMIRKKVPFIGKPEQRKFLLMRGIAGFLALSLHFYTISVLPLGTAVMLNYTGPIFVALLAAIFLGERPGGFLISMTLVSFSGVYLLVSPRHLLFRGEAIPLFLAILSAILAAVAVLAIRIIRHRESPLTVIFYFTAISTLGSLFYLPFGFKWPALKEWFALLLVAGGSFYGQLWMTIAYRRAPASLVSSFSYVTPLLAFFYGLIFWKETLAWTNLAGASLIILGGTLISVFEARRSGRLPFPAA